MAILRLHVWKAVTDSKLQAWATDVVVFETVQNPEFSMNKNIEMDAFLKSVVVTCLILWLEATSIGLLRPTGMSADGCLLRVSRSSGTTGTCSFHRLEHPKCWNSGERCPSRRSVRETSDL